MTANAALAQHRAPKNGNKTAKYNVKNFRGSLTAVVRAQNDTSKTANITGTIFNKKDDNTIAAIDILAICC